MMNQFSIRKGSLISEVSRLSKCGGWWLRSPNNNNDNNARNVNNDGNVNNNNVNNTNNGVVPDLFQSFTR